MSGGAVLWKWLYRVSAAAFAVAGLSHFALSRHFVHTRPKAPILETGAVNYYKGSAGVVYLTDVELSLLESLWIGLVVAGTVAAALLIFKREDSLGRHR